MCECFWVFLAGWTLFGAIMFFAKLPGVLLKKRFARLGEPEGMTEAEIISQVGPPNAVSMLPGGRRVLQWTTGGYSIGLIFKGRVCEAVTHEHLAP